MHHLKKKERPQPAPGKLVPRTKTMSASQRLRDRSFNSGQQES
jgi:hypothetical protein